MAAPVGGGVGAEEVGTHVVVDSDDVHAQTGEMPHGLGSDQPGRAGHESNTHTLTTAGFARKRGLKKSLEGRSTRRTMTVTPAVKATDCWPIQIAMTNMPSSSSLGASNSEKVEEPKQEPKHPERTTNPESTIR